jgi:2-iminobutanoate/2-iminopropanoate deaminase
MEIRDVVKLTLYLAGEMDVEERRLILSAWLNGHRPCMTLIYVAGLASPNLLVEIEALACTEDK